MRKVGCFDGVIRLLRVMSMVLIILCHVIRYYPMIPGSAVLDQVFNVGVYVFLLISGYLYGGKTVTDFGNWLVGRWRRVVIPMIVLVALDAMALAWMGAGISASQLVMLLWNLQGLGFLSWPAASEFPAVVDHLGSLWFVTVIMLCYCMVPVLQYARARVSAFWSVMTIALLLAADVIIYVTMDAAIVYFIAFGIGYWLGSVGLGEREMGVLPYRVLSAVMAGAQWGRLFLRARMDGTSLYTAVVGITQCVLACWIFVTAFRVRQLWPELTDRMSESQIVRWLEGQSYYVYLTHYLFSAGTAFNVYGIFDSLWLSTALFLGLTLSASCVIKYMSEQIDRVVQRMLAGPGPQ